MRWWFGFGTSLLSAFLRLFCLFDTFLCFFPGVGVEVRVGASVRVKVRVRVRVGVKV